MELTQRRPSASGSNKSSELTQRRPSASGAKRSSRSVVLARKESMDHVEMLITVDDNDADHELLFESIDHRISSVEKMLSRNKANKENEWKRKIGKFLVKLCMYFYYFIAWPWFLLIVINFSTYRLSWDYVKNGDHKLVWQQRKQVEQKEQEERKEQNHFWGSLMNIAKEQEEQEEYEVTINENFDDLNDEEFEEFTTFETDEKPQSGAEQSLLDEYREFKRRKKLKYQYDAKREVWMLQHDNYLMQNRFMDFETWEDNKPPFAVSELFENDSYPKFAKDKLSSRRKSYLYDLEALENAAPKHVIKIYARAKASRKLYQYARKIYRKELENENLQEYTSFADEVKKHWKEVLITFGAVVQMILTAALIIILKEHFVAEGAGISEQVLPILAGGVTATVFIFVLYMYTLKGQETREWLDRSLISFLGIECDVILGSTIHFYFVLSLLPLFIVYFLFNWFSTPRFGLKCRDESNIPPIWNNMTPGVFACASDEVYDIELTLCCKVENQMLRPFSK